jgi:hypothetical protein
MHYKQLDEHDHFVLLFSYHLQLLLIFDLIELLGFQDSKIFFKILKKRSKKAQQQQQKLKTQNTTSDHHAF